MPNELPPLPDEGEPCVNNTTLVLVAQCVNGLRVLTWVSDTEISAGQTLAAGGGCPKAKTIQDAIAKGWSPKDVIALAKTL